MARNLSGTLLASAARTATVNSSDIVAQFARGVRISIDVTAASATPSVTPKVQVKDPASGVYSNVLVGAAITGAGHVELAVYPGIEASANVAADAPLAREWRVRMEHGDADSITYSVGYVMLV